jgi:ubiquinone/menaquinone biosynthesis C-methylase UbiE
MAPYKLARLIHPHPDAVAVDIGAGFGLYTFALAEQMAGGTGRVYATDLDEGAVAYLMQEVKERGVKNVIPMQVGDTQAPVYQDNQFDVILIADVIQILEDPVSFLSSLRGRLTPGTGRLWIVSPKPAPDFDPVEFWDFGALRDLVRTHGDKSPLVARLRPEVRQALAGSPEATIPAPLAAQITQDLSRILDDRSFWPEIDGRPRSGRAFFGDHLQYLAGYLNRELDRQNAFAPNAKMSSDAQTMLRLLNRCVIEELLMTRERDRVFYVDRIDGRQHLSRFLGWFHKAVEPILRKAGYEIVKQHEALAYHEVWECKPAQ